MNSETLEEQALHLPKKERTALLQKLLLSLETPAPDELREEWLAESERRAAELDAGLVQTIPGEEVMRKARALIK